MNVIQLAQKLVQFKSTHDNEEMLHTCLNFCVDFFKEYPLVVKQYECDGLRSVVLQTQDGLDIDVMFLVHVDVVPGKDELFKGNIQDGKLFGMGSLDMKAFVATSMMVMKELLDEGYQGNIALAITTDEELGGRCGAGYLAEEIGYQPQVILVPDDGELIGRITSETKHIMQVHFQAVGKAAHACQPWAGNNAIEQLLRTFLNLKQRFPDGQVVNGEEPWINTINLGMIQGGVATNEVPHEASMDVDIRFTKDTIRNDVLGWIEQALVPGVSYSILMEAYPTALDEDSPFVQAYCAAAQQVVGNFLERYRSGGGHDGRFFYKKGACVIVHQGTGGNCQAEDEYVETESLAELVKVQKTFIQNIFPSKKFV